MRLKLPIIDELPEIEEVVFVLFVYHPQHHLLVTVERIFQLILIGYYRCC